MRRLFFARRVYSTHFTRCVEKTNLLIISILIMNSKTAFPSPSHRDFKSTFYRAFIESCYAEIVVKF